MKKINNKGITIIEVLVCFVLVVIISMSLFSTISAYNDKRIAENYKTKIYNYKNMLTKDMQDDFITIGLTHAKYTRTVDNTKKSVKHQVDCNLSDGTKRVLIITQRFTKSSAHPEGNPSMDDEFTIKYGDPDKEVTNYELPDLGNSYVRTDASGKVIACKSKSESSSCRTQKDLSINNVLIDITDDNVISIYIGFYHPELSTRYGVNVVAPMDFTSKLSDMSSGLDVPPPEEEKYTVHYVLGAGATGVASPVTVNVGQPVRLPYANIDNGIHKDGCSLIGWTVNGEGETSVDFSVGSSQTFNRDITLYAVWETEKTKFTNTPGYVPSYQLPATGRYKLQVWGAAGGALSDAAEEMGYGGYAEATIQAEAGTVLYINVGTAGKMSDSNDIVVDGGDNGGGSAAQHGIQGATVGSGGGTTSISIYPADETKTILEGRPDAFAIVAGGGGGSYYEGNTIKGKGGCGGGIVGQSGQNDGVWSSSLNHNITWNIRERFPGCAMGGHTDSCEIFATPEEPTNYTGTSYPLAGAGNGFCGGYISGAQNTGAGGGSSYIVSNNERIVVSNSKTYCYNCMEVSTGEEKISTEYELNANGTSFSIESHSGIFNHSSTLSSLSNTQLNRHVLSSKDGLAMITFLG